MPVDSIRGSIDPVELCRELSALPHRGATTSLEHRAADILERRLLQAGAKVKREAFQTPRTYLTEIWWLLAGLVLGLVLLDACPWLAACLVGLAAGLGLHYFDWRASPVSLLPPRAESENVIGSIPPPATPEIRLILMAHYDSAPVSRLYVPSMVAGFHRSLLVSLALMGAAAVVALCYAAGVGYPVVGWLRWILVLYLLVQGVMSSLDYARLGFTNGAADNATGAAVAIAMAERLWRTPIPAWQVDVVLTGAEEANLKGSLAFLRAHREELNPRHTFVLNLDNLGAGQLKVITRTGSLTSVVYDNPLVRAALETASGDPRFRTVQPGVWQTGDFDSIWFARAGIPSLTLSAQDELGRIPNLHRPSDTFENVDPSVVLLAVDFAEALVRNLAARQGAGT